MFMLEEINVLESIIFCPHDKQTPTNDSQNESLNISQAIKQS